ncbi:unnamed protein product [Diamesa serratosioi]
MVESLCQTDNSCDNGQCENGRILSRKKRMLTFPEGSSLQLVYDQTVPIVAAQLLFTIGVTCALAFELPSKPIFRITQELREKLQADIKGEEPTTPAPPPPPPPPPSAPDAEHSYSDIIYNDHSRIDYNLNYPNNKQNYYDSLNKHGYYYSNNNKQKPASIYNDNYYRKPLSPNNYISDKSDNFNDNYNKNGYQLTNYQSSIAANRIPTSLNQTTNDVWTNVVNRKHDRVFPVFGKRSVDEHITHEEKFYLNHHRSSRFAMYEKIEGFLKGKGKDGNACVRRALCETGQQNQNAEKGPFLMEILRAVFSLPDQVEHNYEKDFHQEFDNAHQQLEHNCAELYSKCETSIWSQDFSF